MGLLMGERHAVLRQMYRRYQQATRQEKSLILNELTSLTDYNRAYAALLLRSYGQEIWLKDKDGPVRIRPSEHIEHDGRGAPRVYGDAVAEAVIKIWYLCDCMCGKRLASAMRTMVPVLMRWSELEISDEVQRKLMSISAASIDRLLQDERRRIQLPRAKAYTKPGPEALRNQVPIRTFEEWDRSEVGHVQADLVGHDGGYAFGDFFFTLTMVDIATGWTEARVVLNKARKWVCEAADEIRCSLPFQIRSLGSDSGTEFINSHFIAWTKQQQLVFTRTRPYRKNDNCYVEERNGSFVRRVAGYARYDTGTERALLTELYQRHAVLANYFYPSMKLLAKKRTGARVYRRYDVPKTPFQRLLELAEGSLDARGLEKVFNDTNPVTLKRELTEIQNQLFDLSANKPPPHGQIAGRGVRIHASQS